MKTTLAAVLILFFLIQPNDKKEGQLITGFSSQSNLEWFAVNDGVMGGLSESSMNNHENGYGIFAGNVSLENNGGFASVRAMVPKNDYTGYDQIVIRVKGDGKKYQLRIRNSRDFDGVSYQAGFTAKPGNWQNVAFSEEDFTPVWRGMVVKDYPAFEFENMKQIGFLIADYQKGNFELMIESIKIE